MALNPPGSLCVGYEREGNGRLYNDLDRQADF